MKKLTLNILFVFIVCSFGFGQEKKFDFGYKCHLPKKLKKEVVLRHKDGAFEKGDAHAIYTHYHSEGWNAMVSNYIKTGSVDLEILPAALWGLHTTARDIGILEARILILKAELVIGPEKVRIALKNKIGEKTTTAIKED